MTQQLFYRIAEQRGTGTEASIFLNSADKKNKVLSLQTLHEMFISVQVIHHSLKETDA